MRLYYKFIAESGNEGIYESVFVRVTSKDVVTRFLTHGHPACATVYRVN